MSDALDPSKVADAALITNLNETLGNFFGSAVAADSAWAREILGLGVSSS